MSRDPFEDSKDVLEAQLRRCSRLRRDIEDVGRLHDRKLGSIGEARFRGLCEELCVTIEEAREDVALLADVVAVLQERGGKLAGRRGALSSEVVSERARYVTLASQRLKDFVEFARQLEVEHHNDNAAKSSTSDDLETARKNDDFIGQHTELQHEQIAEQERSLDVLSQGVGNLRVTAVTIADEMNEQAQMLDDVDGRVDNLSDKLRSVNAKVDKVIQGMSTNGKLCCITLLVLVVGMLIALFFFG